MLALVSFVGRSFFALGATFALTSCAAHTPITELGPAYPEGPAPELAKNPEPRPAAPTPAPAAPNNVPPNPRASPLSLPGFGYERFAGDSPIAIEAASEAGNWVSLCKLPATEASRSGALARFLVSPGEELPIQYFLRASPNGRYAVVLRDGAAVLWDATTRGTLDLSSLGADARLSAETGAAVRTFDFDTTSEHLLYVRRREQETRIVVRTLADGSERELSPGAGEVWRASFDPGGAYITVQLVSTDTNHNGRLDFPLPLLKAPRACELDRARFHAYEPRGDRPEIALIPLTGGDTVHDPELVMPLADALILRDENGVLALSRAGKKQVLEPAECKARIVHADARREFLLVGCAQKKKSGHVSLELVTRAGRKPLNLEQAIVDYDRETSDSPRLVALYPGTDTVLFDAEKKDVVVLQPGDSVLAVEQTHALIRRGQALVLFDANTRKEQPLAGEVAKFPQVLRTSPFLFISPLLVDVARGEVVGSTQARPLALSDSGQILLAETDADGSTLARGPLRWETPAPVAPPETRARSAGWWSSPDG